MYWIWKLIENYIMHKLRQKGEFHVPRTYCPQLAISKNYLTTPIIGVVKSYLPQFNLAPNYSDEKFQEYCKESKVTAEEILKNLAE